MSGRGSGGGPNRGAGGPTQTTWARDGVGAILVVLAVGLAFRLLIVKVYGGTGLEFDLGSFWGWADNLASQGLNGFYQRDFFHDYTPGYLYVLYAVGLLSQAALSPYTARRCHVSNSKRPALMRTRVFSTTIGHNNDTVGDPRYLDLVTRGLLWAVNKLDDKNFHTPAKKTSSATPK